MTDILLDIPYTVLWLSDDYHVRRTLRIVKTSWDTTEDGLKLMEKADGFLLSLQEGDRRIDCRLMDGVPLEVATFLKKAV